MTKKLNGIMAAPPPPDAAYIILSAFSSDELAELVNAKIASGYAPVGSVTVSIAPGPRWWVERWLQAVVKNSQG